MWYVLTRQELWHRTKWQLHRYTLPMAIMLRYDRTDTGNEYKDSGPRLLTMCILGVEVHYYSITLYFQKNSWPDMFHLLLHLFINSELWMASDLFQKSIYFIFKMVWGHQVKHTKNLMIEEHNNCLNSLRNSEVFFCCIWNTCRLLHLIILNSLFAPG